MRVGFALLIAIRAVSANPEAEAKQPADCGTSIEPRKPDPDAKYGYIHEIIGKDGALLISLLRSPDRFDYSSAKLKEAGIIANQFPAADGYCDSEEDIERGCFLNGDQAKNDAIKDQCKAKQGWGWGCDGMPTAACAESHHRALQVAQHRKHNWTLIMEDDAVPLEPAAWQENFKEAWQKVPGWAKLVRLGWCTFPVDVNLPLLPVQPRNVPEIMEETGKFKLIRQITTGSHPGQIGTPPPPKYDAGLCTTAYMIHREAVTDMLGVFPCCCGMDCCMGQSLINLPMEPGGQTWGFKRMVSIDMSNSTESTIGWNKHPYMYQYGALVQDNRPLKTVRD
mmetsp:Transcript_145662/g.271241  ORF Transcript_145662/g.271241 Transcript_145662/m.271241 type:complete len:337 (+) Transcript_145662:67-1077(+)